MANLTSTIKLKLNSTEVKRGIASIKSSFKSVGRDIGDMAANAAKFSAAIAAAGVAFAGFKGVQFLTDSVKAAAAYESLAISFEVLTGSAAKARNVLKDIEKFGATTPLEQGDLQEATKTLMAMGVSVEDTMPILKMLGDVSMGNGERLKSLALVFGQISSAGKLTGGDLLQLVNLGFNPLQSIAKKTGKSMGELRDEMSKGGISLAMVREAFEDATGEGGTFENMLSRMSETAEGKFSNLKDNVEALKRSLGAGLLDGVKTGLDALNTQLGDLQGVFKTLGEDMGMMIASGLAGNAEPILSAFDYLFARVGEILVGYLQEALIRGIGEGLPALQRAGANMVEDSFLNKSGIIKAGVAATRSTADFLEGQGGGFDREDFQELSKGMFDSVEKQQKMLDELRALRQAAQRTGSVPVLPEGYAY